MNSDVKNWIQKSGEQSLRRIGINDGDKILDFGCGYGYYSIPLAKISTKGIVYALDMNAKKITEFKKSLQNYNLNNIKIIQTSGELKLPFADESLDFVLLFDVLHNHYFTAAARIKVLLEINRITKKDGLISVFPKHMIEKELKKDMKKTNFSFRRKIKAKVLHFYSLEDNTILNFQKMN